jgi:hypothetical protein
LTMTILMNRWFLCNDRTLSNSLLEIVEFRWWIPEKDKIFGKLRNVSSFRMTGLLETNPVQKFDSLKNCIIPTFRGQKRSQSNR